MAIDQIHLPLKRITMPNGEKKVFVDEQGQAAETRILQVEWHARNNIKYSGLTIRLMTGRTHQIRVHCQSQGHEVAGDAKYGDRDFNRQMKQLGSKRMLLHAAELEIPANAHTKAIKIFSPDPEEFRILTQDEH